jgi:hypothetical protein
LPAAVKGHFDHLAIDLKGNRLFATPEDFKAVLVLDPNTGALVHTIEGIGKPHAVFYRGDLNRIYLTDGVAGRLEVFDGETYKLLQSVKLLKDADSIGYDLSTRELHIDNGSGDEGQKYSMLTRLIPQPGRNWRIYASKEKPTGRAYMSITKRRTKSPSLTAGNARSPDRG